VRTEHVLGELDPVEEVAGEHLGLRQQRVGTGHAAPDDPQRTAGARRAPCVELLGMDREVMLEERHLGDAVERAGLVVEQLAGLQEHVLDEQLVVVVEGVLPVDVQVGVLTEHDHVLGVDRDAEPLAQRELTGREIGKRRPGRRAARPEEREQRGCGRPVRGRPRHASAGRHDQGTQV